MNLFLNNHKKRNYFLGILGKIVILALFIFVLNLFGSGVKGFFYKISSPFQKVFLSSANNTAGVLQSVFNAGSLEKENENLKKENENLLAQISQLKDQGEQDIAVKEVLSTCSPEDLKLVLVNTIGFDSAKDFITIDKGSDDGILENMPVINQQKALFGKVFKVYKKYSDVMLISNKNMVFDAVILNQDVAVKPVHGIVKGRGGLEVYLDLVPVDSEIKPGDVLITSALDGVLPKDLLVGKVKSKSKNELKPFQTAEINSFFNPKETDKLFVIVNYKK